MNPSKPILPVFRNQAGIQTRNTSAQDDDNHYEIEFLVYIFSQVLSPDILIQFMLYLDTQCHSPILSSR